MIQMYDGECERNKVDDTLENCNTLILSSCKRAKIACVKDELLH